MDPVTKTYVSFGLVIIALFEFWAAMSVFGKKGPPGKSAKLKIRMHRIGGYVFLAYFVWISWVCLDLMNRLANAGYQLDSRGTIHATIAWAVIFVLLLKISFVRVYQKYRLQAPMLGMSITISTLVLWFLAGYMFLWLMK